MADKKYVPLVVANEDEFEYNVAAATLIELGDAVAIDTLTTNANHAVVVSAALDQKGAGVCIRRADNAAGAAAAIRVKVTTAPVKFAFEEGFVPTAAQIGADVYGVDADTMSLSNGMTGSQVLTATPTAANTTVYTAQLYKAGVLVASAQLTSDGSATATEICDAIRTQFGTVAGAAIGGTATLTVTATANTNNNDFELVSGGPGIITVVESGTFTAATRSVYGRVAYVEPVTGNVFVQPLLAL